MTEFFDENKIEQLARKSNFIQRSSKLKAHMFLESVMFNTFDNIQTSLNDYTDSLFFNHKVKLSKQAVYDRFNNNSVLFVQSVLKELIKTNLIDHFKVNYFKKFNRVLIKDSTAFGLPVYMKDKFKGTGGNSTEAAARIQYEYDLKSGNVTDLSLSQVKINDYENAKITIGKIRKGDLIIRDLGYSGLDRLNDIKGKEAFFLNRLKPDMGIYTEENGKYIPLSHNNIRKELTSIGTGVIEKNVFIGRRKYMPVRLVVFKVPEDQIKERIAKQLKKSKKRCSKVQKSVLNKVDMNMFITNVESSVLPAESVYKIYKLRWQIELIFKIWKSLVKIHLYKPVKQERIETVIYAKLILIMLNWAIITSFTNRLFEKIKCSLSYYKAYKTLLSVKSDLLKYLHSHELLKAFLTMLYKKFLYSHIKEKRKGRDFSQELILNYAA